MHLRLLFAIKYLSITYLTHGLLQRSSMSALRRVHTTRPIACIPRHRHRHRHRLARHAYTSLRPTRTISSICSCGELNGKSPDTPTSSRRSSRGCRYNKSRGNRACRVCRTRMLRGNCCRGISPLLTESSPASETSSVKTGFHGSLTDVVILMMLVRFDEYFCVVTYGTATTGAGSRSCSKACKGKW